ncbi:hypothetical protein [Candidatus Poriferisodalis sp.]|uniref:hypothetical protein n=1 Tax=Candidatus Poriferisodalis sp. TaxID=3101277 RepID=UPI003B01B76A
MRRILTTLVAVLSAAAMTLTMAAPAQATGDKVLDDGTIEQTKPDSNDPAPVGDADTTIELPDDLERTVEKALRHANYNGSAARWPCFLGIGDCSRPSPDTGWLDCADITVDEIGVSWAANDGYDTIHIVPTDAGRGGSLIGPAATINGANLIFAEALLCLNSHNLSVTVNSWTAIWQQLHCHIVYQLLGGGGSWDLEGHRDTNWGGYLLPWNRCGW